MLFRVSVVNAFFLKKKRTPQRREKTQRKPRTVTRTCNPLVSGKSRIAAERVVIVLIFVVREHPINSLPDHVQP